MDERLQRPDPRPFANRVGKRRAVGREEGHQHVIHVGAVVDDEDHRGVRVDRLEALAVEMAKAHAVELPAEPARRAGGKAEIGRGRKARHDLAGIGARALEGHALGYALRARGFADRLRHLGIVDQALDHVVAARELEGLYGPGEAPVQPRHGALHPAAEEPAHRRGEDLVERRDGGKGQHQQERPERDFNRACHGRSVSHQAASVQKNRHGGRARLFPPL